MFEIDEQYLKSLPVSTPTKPVSELYGKEAIAYLADVIEREDFRFDMADPFIATCGTAGCVAGQAAAIWKDCAYLHAYSDDGVCNRLQISRGELHRIAYPDRIRSRTRTQAVSMLRRYIATDKIEWRESQQT